MHETSGGPGASSPGENATFEAVKEVLEGANRILVLGHVNIDADCLGSGLALVHALRARGKRADFCCDSVVPRNCTFLPGTDEVIRYDPDRELELRATGYQAVVLSDIPNPDRIERLEPFFRAFPGPTINLDHHVSNGRYGTHDVVDLEASSTGEIVFHLLLAAGYPLTPEVATCLYTAIISDTGRFTYDNTTARTHRTTATLHEAGADVRQAVHHLYQTRPPGEVRIHGMAIARLGFARDGAIAWTAVSRAMLDEAGALPEDTQNLSEACRAIAGVRVGILFRETQDPARIKASLRSDGTVDVNRLAGHFGGGGHVAAAGCRLTGTLEEAAREVLDELETHWAEYAIAGEETGVDA